MRQIARRALAVSLAALVVGQAAAAPAPGKAPCRHVEVIAPDGEPVSGIEDMAYDGRAGRLILSAYDRRAAQAHRTQGGLYTVDIAALDGDRIDAEPLAVHGAGAGADAIVWFPHGIALLDGPGGRRLAVINRIYDGGEDAEPDGAEAELLVLDVTGKGATLAARLVSPALCRANDVAFASADTLLVTRDHAACAGRDAWIERLSLAARSGVVRVRPGDAQPVVPVLENLAFANGIAVDSERGLVHVAATRAGEVTTYRLDDLVAGGATPMRRVAVGAGPDNLTLMPDGGVLVAAHPSLMRLFLHIAGLAGPPDSTVVEIGPDGSVAVLADASAALPAAATTATRAGGRLVVSSAWDRGLGICRPMAENERDE